MWNRTQLREVLSGERRGLAATALRLMAACGEPFYYAGSAWRNRQYDRVPTKSRGVEVPVISIGNITVGGTGKTPMVEWVARQAIAHKRRPVLISRGYGADAHGPNDEALELAQKLPAVPHVQNADRLAAARQAIERHGADCLVLDDAFQHRRIRRDLDIVLLDATEPFGHGHLLPRGLLRESLAGLQRADAILLSRADAVSAEQRRQIWHRVDCYAPDTPRAEACHAPASLLASDGTTLPLSQLQAKRVGAFCGIGNPAAFEATLKGCGCEVIGWRTFPDHHRYQPADLQALAEWTERLSGVDYLLCTQKDLVKITARQIAAVPLFALAVGMKFLSGQEPMERLIAAVLDGSAAESRSG